MLNSVLPLSSFLFKIRITTNNNWLIKPDLLMIFLYQVSKLYYYQIIAYEELFEIGKKLSFCLQWVAQFCTNSLSSGYYHLWSSSRPEVTELSFAIPRPRNNIILLYYFTNDCINLHSHQQCARISPFLCYLLFCVWLQPLCLKWHWTSVWFRFASPLWLVMCTLMLCIFWEFSV